MSAMVESLPRGIPFSRVRTPITKKALTTCNRPRNGQRSEEYSGRSLRQTASTLHEPPSLSRGMGTRTRPASAAPSRSTSALSTLLLLFSTALSLFPAQLRRPPRPPLPPLHSTEHLPLPAPPSPRHKSLYCSIKRRALQAWFGNIQAGRLCTARPCIRRRDKVIPSLEQLSF